MRRTRLLCFAVWGACVMPMSGCATVRRLSGYQPGDPVLMSGTRLDTAAIGADRVALDRFHASPPAWPWLDLPFSFVADLFFWILPRKAATPANE